LKARWEAREEGAATMTSQPIPADPEFRAPDLLLGRDDGADVQLASLWAERPLVLAFFGDLANPFTGDNAAQLRDADEAFAKVDADIAAIVSSTPEQSTAFRRALLLPYPLLSDPDGSARTAFGVEPGAAATFVVTKDGTASYARRAENLADYPPTSALIAAICEITGAEPPAPPPPSFTLPQDEPLERIENGRIVRYERFTCGKCGYDDCERGEIATAGGFLSRLFNLQHKKFVAVSCRSCGYTELYKRSTGMTGNVVDFLAGS
jgi:predicted nucleic-acid-binding Zn-ribbon protein/peroxiredoxin